MLNRWAGRLFALLACGSAAACASSGSTPPQTNVMTETLTATRVGMGDAVRAPLTDFNVVRTEIPQVLTTARENPYAMPVRLDCPALQFDIQQLDLVLGPDLDVPSDPTNRALYARGGEAASNAALDAVRDATTGWIPFRNVVRRLSGAQQAESDLKSAVLAGTIRRAYLKGLGETHGCSSPGAPLRLHEARAAEAAAAAANGTSAETPRTVARR